MLNYCNQSVFLESGSPHSDSFRPGIWVIAVFSDARLHTDYADYIVYM